MYIRKSRGAVPPSPPVPQLQRGDSGMRSPTISGPTARFLGEGEHNPDLVFGYNPDDGNGVILGVTDGGVVVASLSDQHLITQAGARSGKGVSCLVPNLLAYRGSMIVLDPKGELASMTARFRREVLGQRVHILDPFEKTAEWCAPYRKRFNPMRRLPGSTSLVEDGGVLADGLITPSGGDNVHWDEAARSLLRGLLCHTATYEDFEGARSLLTVRDMMMLGRDLGELDGKPTNGMEGLNIEMRDNKASHVVPYAAAEHFSRGEKERESVMSTLRRQLEWLDYDAMRHQISGDDFALEDLCTAPEGCTLYLCLPVSRLAAASKWMRAIIMEALRMVEDCPLPPERPRLLFMLDEAALLEPMPNLVSASAYLPGFGCRLWQFYQSSGQIEDKPMGIYRSNAGVVQLFGNGGDMDALEWLTRRAGKTQISVRTAGEMSADDRRRGGMGWSTHAETVDLISPEEASRLFGRSSGKQLILTPEGRPTILNRIKYYDHPYFRGKFDPPA